jgi:Ferredoxin-like domain in Api92-like protein
MPNWCENRLIVTGPEDDLARFAAATICWSADKDTEAFDFNAVIPIPTGLVDLPPLTHEEEVAVSFLKLLAQEPLTMMDRFRLSSALSGSNRSVPVAEYLSAKPNTAEIGQRGLERFHQYGAIDWYDWRTHHWGTKWNSNATRIAERTSSRIDIHFETAWSPPKPVVAAASNAYPTLTFDHAYIEESMCFSGQARYSDGDVFVEHVYEDVPDMMKLAVWGYLPDPEEEDC